MTERASPLLPESSRFADGKEPGALRTIGEVADALGIRQHVLRYWEEQFPTLRPLKRSGGRRYYRVEDVALVERIDRLVHREGYTLRGARLVIEGKSTAKAPDPLTGAGADPAPANGATASDEIAAASVPGEPVIVALQGIRARLAAALDR